MATQLGGHGELAAVEPIDFGPGLTVVLEFRVRGRTVGVARGICWRVIKLLEAIDAGEFDCTVVITLLQAGFAESLTGQPEGQWLDVKAQPYADTEAGYISLAEDAAAFANSPGGGVLVLGIATKKTTGGEEVLSKIHPLSVDPKRLRKYRAAIDRRVFPPIRNLTVCAVGHDGGELVWIHIPDQADEIRPFLVKGAVQGASVRGAAITVPRRRSDMSMPVTVEEIHTYLVVGRALLKGTIDRNSPPT